MNDKTNKIVNSKIQEALRKEETAECYEQEMTNELRQLGINVNSVWELTQKKQNDSKAVSILLKYLRSNFPNNIKDGIIRALATMTLDIEQTDSLIAEFKKQDSILIKWSIANTIEASSKEINFDKIKSLIDDDSNGKAREMLVVALAKANSDLTIGYLESLLNNNDLVGYAIIALNKLRAKGSVEIIRAIQAVRKDWVGKEAGKFLKKFDK